MILTRLPRKLALKLRSEVALRDQLTVDALRRSVEQSKARAHLRPNVERVTRIVQDIMSITDLDATAKAMDVDDHDTAVSLVLDVVAAFGTWIGHSIGTTATVVVPAADVEQLPLMQLPHMLVDRKSKLPTVILPPGYEPGAAHGRDVSKALSLIVVTDPGDEMIGRFVSRTYQPRSVELTYPFITGVWDFARRGRLHRIDRVSDDPVFHELVVESYDLLEVSRRDAVTALAALADPRTPPQELRRLVVLSRWLAPDEVARIERCLDHPGADGANLQREQLLLAARIDDQPLKLQPESIAELAQGQVLGIIRAAGVRVDSERGLELEIRAGLKNLGLSGDTDRLLPEAQRAASRGKLDEFWAVMNARVEGDLTWTEQLGELLSGES